MSIVLITGGGRGLGAGTALECARRGMGVVLAFNARRDAAEAVVGQIALGRVGEAADVGAMAASLLGPANARINGRTIGVSGGYAL
ncbi:hypothetical protein [Oceanicella sp. SM1341]|uniref:hypothetical protein n=1 Tax=Oceanicella sp. SM1341 TaxID=1548889 RepID=UPI000E4C1D52|nr:hypothetical protein [Oceanicella sp. SM1341]